MANKVDVNSAYDNKLKTGIENAKVLLVGAGGIGCELLKNLVLAGFKEIDVIDLDTIDVSNLNRQFLFQRCHVGKSKALAAKESVLRFNPEAKINAHHDNITGSKYGVSFFKQFSLVLNALDNISARSHVNRMCLAAEIPLVESGTAGYTGQVEVILKGKTECYECQPRQAQRTFPGCTIRNTPSEPIHCIVWAKHLFNQLFGEEDADEDVSPDTADPEAVGDAGESALAGNMSRVSTRQWAKSNGYDPEKLFRKLFHDDLKYLLSMHRLWERRRPPTPLEWASLPDAAMAGNIIPAIATTNAIIAGLVCLRAFQIINQHLEDCKTVQLYVDTEVMKVAELEEQVLKKSLHMVAPDVTLSGSYTIVISSEEGELDNGDMLLKDAGIIDGVILQCDDFLQEYKLTVTVFHRAAKKDEAVFKVVAKADELKPQEKVDEENGADKLEDDLEVVATEMEVSTPSLKRAASPDGQPSAAKKARQETVEDSDGDDDCQLIQE
ncbi:hypothetical protein B566_EDAN013911 [Ephemera danica]|nr:hypothetical protein B566_EDAN013911 [Ephemera danica]